MATEIVEGTGPVVTATGGHVGGSIADRAVAPQRMSWGAIIAGAVAALGLWLLLYSFGLAIGLSTVDQNDPSSLKSSGIFAGVWGVLAPLIALFVGGFVAARGAGVVDRGHGALHGLVMWGLTALLGLWFVTNLLGTVMGGVASAGKAAMQAGGAVVSGAAAGASQSGDALAALGLDENDLLAPVNQRLRAEGKPAVTAQQLQAVVRDVSGDALRAGRVDRDMLVSSVAQHTALDRQDAQQLADRMSTQIDQKRAQLSQQVDRATTQVQQGALRAADATGKAFWGVFGALFLGLVSAVLGAVTGVSRAQRRWATGTTAVPTRPLREREV